MKYAEVKPFLQSKTVWALIVSTLAMVLANTSFGEVLSDTATQAHLVDTILQVVAGVSTLLGIVFRATASKKLV